MLERYAVLLGGGSSQRFGLDDGVVITTNHIAVAGGIAAAVKDAKTQQGQLHKIEVQVANASDLREALSNGADNLLLENLSPEEVSRLTILAKDLSPTVTVKCAGNITLENIRSYAEAAPIPIGVSALTNSARAMDVSFQLQPF
jgi:nicotinate-nucleotide pyrophosphorylase (carboxylating)